MTQKADTKEIVRLALVPICPGKYFANRWNFSFVSWDARPNYRAQKSGGMEIIIHNFHLTNLEPIHAGNGVQPESLVGKVFGSTNYLIGSDSCVHVIAVQEIIDRLKRYGQVRERIRQGCRSRRRRCGCNVRRRDVQAFIAHRVC